MGPFGLTEGTRQRQQVGDAAGPGEYKLRTSAITCALGRDRGSMVFVLRLTATIARLSLRWYKRRKRQAEGGTRPQSS